MIRPIVLFGDSVLRTVGARVANVNEDVQHLVSDMLETMRHADGVGLAAQQVGVALQVAVIDVTDAENRPSRMWINGEEVNPVLYMPLVLINPELTLSTEKEVGQEGCLSFPKMTADIVRSTRVRCRAINQVGEPLDFESEGLLARAVQHEVDHLNGILFIDRMSSAAKAALAGKLKRLSRGAR
jgi:peptide deformylase